MVKLMFHNNNYGFSKNNLADFQESNWTTLKISLIKI